MSRFNNLDFKVITDGGMFPGVQYSPDAPPTYSCSAIVDDVVTLNSLRDSRAIYTAARGLGTFEWRAVFEVGSSAEISFPDSGQGVANMDFIHLQAALRRFSYKGVTTIEGKYIVEMEFDLLGNVG